jgi:hypothetical protein
MALPLFESIEQIEQSPGGNALAAQHGHRLPIGLKHKRSRLGAIHQQRQEAQQIA